MYAEYSHRPLRCMFLSDVAFSDSIFLTGLDISEIQLYLMWRVQQSFSCNQFVFDKHDDLLMLKVGFCFLLWEQRQCDLGGWAPLLIALCFSNLLSNYSISPLPNDPRSAASVQRQTAGRIYFYSAKSKHIQRQRKRLSHLARLNILYTQMPYGHTH